MVGGRSMSRGRYDGSPEVDSYRGGLGSAKKYGGGMYDAAPRSPSAHRSASRSRASFDRSPYDDHRNPNSEGRTFSGSSPGGGGYGARSASSMRERFAVDDDSAGGSAAHAREVLSMMRSGVTTPGGRITDRRESGRGMYTDPTMGGSRVANPMRGLARQMSAMSTASPRRRLDLDAASLGDGYEEASSGNLGPASRYEVMGMKEVLKKKNAETANLRRDLDEMCMKHEDEMSDMRSKLVTNFKDDMREMKAEWEDAFQRLKDEGESAQRAIEMELEQTKRGKAECETALAELRADLRKQLEEERARHKEQMDELRRSKEDDLERLRSMYEEHLNGTKKAAGDVEAELKEEIHTLLEENEKVKRCYDDLEAEAGRYKADLEDINAEYQRALEVTARREKEATAYKEELAEVQDENEKATRRNKVLEDDLSAAKEDLERANSQCERARAEKARFEREFDAISKERDDAASEYDDLVKKLDAIQEERTLESRYTEALVNQRDNMNAIIENGQAEVEELKAVNDELTNANKGYEKLSKEFHLVNSRPETFREELAKADHFSSMAKEFHFMTANGEYPSGDLDDAASSMRDELARAEGMKERLETLGRERERYNATVKALKYDLKTLHGHDIGPETSLQEHMRLLNEKWESNASQVEHADRLKSELDESVSLLEENAKDRERLLRDHSATVEGLKRDLQETQTALVKMEREKVDQDELQRKCDKLEDRLAYVDGEWHDREGRLKELEADNKSLNSEVEKLCKKKNDLEDALDKLGDVKKGLKKKLESAYYDLEEAQRELENSKVNADEVSTLREKLSRITKDQERDIEEAQTEVAESFKVQLRLMEEKHADQEQRNTSYLEQRYKTEVEDLRRQNAELEQALHDKKGSLEQKSMAEIKRRGEFAKQKQELEILRSKERHLETHVSQLEEHISKVVADYEARLQSSNATTCSMNSGEEKALKKQVKDLEKKLEVSSAAMKQIGKSSLLLEKENERLKNDKQELKIKLKKLVDCAEKFGPKS